MRLEGSVFGAVDARSSPGWRFSTAHARAFDAFDPAAGSGPTFDDATMAAQRSAASTLCQAIRLASAGTVFDLGGAHYRFSGGATITPQQENVTVGSGDATIVGTVLSVDALSAAGASMTFDGGQGVTILGADATLWVEHATDLSLAPNVGLTFAGFQGLRLSNVTVDSYPHACCQARVTSVDRANGTVVVTGARSTDPGYPALAGARLDADAAWWSAAANAVVGVGAVSALGAAWSRTSEVGTLRGNPAWIGALDRTIGSPVGVGDVLVIPAANAALISVAANSSGVVLSDVTVHAGSPAIKVAGPTTLVDVVVTRRPRTGRVFGSAGDGVVAEGVSTTLLRTEVGWAMGNGVDCGDWVGVVCSSTSATAARVAIAPASPAVFGAGNACSFWSPCCHSLGAPKVVTSAVVAGADLSAASAAIGANIAGWTAYDLALDSSVNALVPGTVVDAGGSSNYVVDDSYVHDAMGKGVWISGTSSASLTNSYVSGQVFVGAETRTRYKGFPRNVSVSNNWVEGSVMVGALTSAASQLPNGPARTPISNVSLVRNVVLSPAPGGVQAYYAEGKIRDNYVAPLSSATSFRCGIASNARVTQADVAIAVGAANVTVSRNLTSGSVYAFPIASQDAPLDGYHISLPAEPKFTDIQIQSQLAAGSALWSQVLVAAADPSVSQFVVPPGNYGFAPAAVYPGQGWYSTSVFKDVLRPDDKPFTLVADGATFWSRGTTFQPNVLMLMAVIGSSNINIRGLTIDKYDSQTIDGVLRAIDVPNNRILVELLPGTFSDASTILGLGTSGFTQYRIQAVKPDGALITPFYKVDSGHGPTNMALSSITADSVPGRYWYTFLTTTLLKTVFTPRWYDAYGLRGTMCVGDGISIDVQGATMCLAVLNSKNVTVADCTAYMGFVYENGGYGGHKYTRVAFTRRPGTNPIRRGGMQLGGRMRVGSVYDGCYMGLTNDDAFNIMALNDSSTISIAGDTATLSLTPSGLRAGDTVEFYNMVTGELNVSYVVASVPSTQIQPVFFHQPVTMTTTPASYLTTDANLKAYFPSCRSAGWVIKNSTFESNYQRLLFQTGPGEFSNNVVRGMGYGLHLGCNFNPEGEGGFAEGIVVANNAFLECGVGSDTAVVASFVAPFSTSNAQRVRNMVVRDNAFVGCGGAAIATQHVQDSAIERNVIVDPMRKNLLANIAPGGATAIRNLGTVGNVSVRDNRVVMLAPLARASTVDPVCDLRPFLYGARVSNNAIVIDVARRVYQAGYDAYSAGLSARDIIAAVRGAM